MKKAASNMGMCAAIIEGLGKGKWDTIQGKKVIRAAGDTLWSKDAPHAGCTYHPKRDDPTASIWRQNGGPPTCDSRAGPQGDVRQRVCACTSV